MASDKEHLPPVNTASVPECFREILGALRGMEGIQVTDNVRIKDCNDNLGSRYLLRKTHISLAPKDSLPHADDFTVFEQPIVVQELNLLYDNIIAGLPNGFGQIGRVSSRASEEKNKIWLPYCSYDRVLPTNEFNDIYAKRFGTFPEPYELRMVGLSGGIEQLTIIVFPSTDLAEIDSMLPNPYFTLGARVIKDA
ncbi:MAG TPA: hypothetical protein VGT05_02870 [Patescibacteria group bacterium]|nr:hypothetical protein [Patescibacteria group bacterium]